ncbi:MAG TPA: glycoside hydrolase family 88 protein [Rectinemataceae bacterium]|nr:glycoside hydrolase family 88 protein [Rectinemataceae bacterium]
MKSIRDEGLESPARYDAWPYVDGEIWKAATAETLSRTIANLALYPTGYYPAPASVALRYPAIANVEWTTSFWTGILWLSWELSGDGRFRDAAFAQIPDFLRRLDGGVAIETHDLGFLYTLSCVAPWRLLGAKEARKTALKAATLLMGRYYEKAGIIQAWGDLDDPSQRGRIIIDCAMNLPLLFWASEQTGDPRYREAAKRHLSAANEHLLREDGSSYHTYHFDIENGEGLRGSTAQGSSDSSCWARGQAWGIYGLSLGFRYLRDPELLGLASRLAHYFLNRTPSDWVCYWDLAFTEGEEERDSSAAAIAACGLLELAGHLSVADARKRRFENAAAHIAASLVSSYAARPGDGSNGLLLHAVYSKPAAEGIDECCIWGDYFYLELLARLQLSWKPYW